MIRFFFIWMVLFCLFSCGPRETQVILLPQEGEPIGSVTVDNKDGVTSLDKPFTSTSTKTQTGSKAKGLAVATADAKEINKQFSGLFTAELNRDSLRKKPIPETDFIARFTLYFESGNTRLTEDSHVRLPGFLKLIKDNAPCDVTIDGHTDTLGHAGKNMDLSVRRAKKAAALLKPVSSSIRTLRIKGHGEYFPRIPTSDDADEPRNRRVRITIQ